MATGQLNGVLRHLRTAALVWDDGGMTDGQLLACFITRRDEAAFEALVRRHGPMVMGVCHRLLGHAQDAEDAFQATFLVLVRKAASIRQRELVGNWLYGAAYRAALEVKAAKRRAKERQVSAMPEPVVVDQAEVWRDLRLLLDQEVNRLPDKYRMPIVLCDLEGRTRRDIARQLGIPEGTLSAGTTPDRLVAATDKPSTPPVARDSEVQKILDKYHSFRPDDKDLGIFQLDWAPTLKDAKEKAAKEKRPIFLLVVTNSFGNLYTGHC